MEKFNRKCVKALFKIIFPCLYNLTLPKIGSGSGENFWDPAPDPIKKVRIRNPADQTLVTNIGTYVQYDT